MSSHRGKIFWRLAIKKLTLHIKNNTTLKMRRKKSITRLAIRGIIVLVIAGSACCAVNSSKKNTETIPSEENAEATDGADATEAYAVSSADNKNRNVSSKTLPKEILRLEFPRVKGGGENVIIVHATDAYGVTFSTEYDTSLKSQRWSCYAVYKDNNFKAWARKNWKGAYWQGRTWSGDPFQKDPAIDEGDQPPYSGEYSKSGYQRGHIVASADRCYDMEANGQTYYMTNMQPMMGSLNMGLWEKMEKKVRNLLSYDMSKNQSTHAADTLYVCKGGTIDREDQIYGRTLNGYIVPKYFFCAVLLKDRKGYHAIGYWFEHKPAYDDSDRLEDHIVSIDQLEQLTGLDFFCNLPDDVEQEVEKTIGF